MEKQCEACGKLFDCIKGPGYNNRLTCYECTNGNRKLTWRNKHLKRNYGITLYQLRVMFEKLNGKCELCQSDMTFDNGNYKAGEKRNGRECCVDHCHTTKKVRGLLCFHCNTAIGHLFDNPETINRINGYLTK